MAAKRWRRVGGAFAAILVVLSLAGYWLLDHYKTELYEFSMRLGAREAGLSAHQIQIGEHRLHYLDNPDAADKPVILLVHGFGAFKENWIPLAMELAPGFRMVSVDLPGHGQSTYLPDHDYDIDQQVEALHGFAEKVIGKPFYMVGNSMGGAITAMYAGTYPDDILGAILLDPGHIYDFKSELYEYLKKGVHPLITRTEEEFDFLVDFTMEQPPFIPWPFSAVSAKKMADRYHKNQKIWQDITSDHDYEFKEIVRRIQAPTLIVWGRQDRVIDYRNGAVYQQLIGNAELKVLDNVGHAPMIEVPGRTASLITDFVSRTGDN
ncbi:MAG: alpha/beta hydrolase [Ketobacteraceae bacterium]|nr:alpha/beta hydrolase [Ketobacteraceae bacterium]